MKTILRLSAVSAIAGAVAVFTALAGPHFAVAADKIIAKVNGIEVTESDVALAEEEIGSDLGKLPPADRRRVLVEYTIENILFAEAAKGQKLANTDGYTKRMRYWRRRALRDQYFNTTIKGLVSEGDARAIYEKQVKAFPPKEEVNARHILVKTIEEANDITEKLSRGEDFAALAKKHSLDPGSKARGGGLGYFSKGQMVPAFEKAAFALKKGDVSEPVKSRFGYHVIMLVDRRTSPPPPFASIKKRLLMSMMHQKATETAARLRKSAKIEIIDPVLKKQVEAQGRGSGLTGQ